jgi:hypothetical protein
MASLVTAAPLVVLAIIVAMTVISMGYLLHRNTKTKKRIEAFQNLDPSDANYLENLHTHPVVDLHVQEQVQESPDGLYSNGFKVAPHTHVFYGAGDGEHSHLPGQGGPWLSTGDNANFNANHDNFEHWINPYESPSGGKMGMQVNLTKLNEATNKCKLAKTLPWVEAHAKCD